VCGRNGEVVRLDDPSFVVRDADRLGPLPGDERRLRGRSPPLEPCLSPTYSKYLAPGRLPSITYPPSTYRTVPVM